MRMGCHAALLQAVHKWHIALETKFWLHWSLVGHFAQAETPRRPQFQAGAHRAAPGRRTACTCTGLGAAIQDRDAIKRTRCGTRPAAVPGAACVAPPTTSWPVLAGDPEG